MTVKDLPVPHLSKLRDLFTPDEADRILEALYRFEQEHEFGPQDTYANWRVTLKKVEDLIAQAAPRKPR